MKKTSVAFLAILVASGCGDGDGSDGSGGPPAPVLRVAAGADGRTSLRWDEVPGADRYHVKRAVRREGPYVTVARGVRGTAHSGAGQTQWRRVYYAVSAVNAAGEGPDSKPIAVHPRPAAGPPAAPEGAWARSLVAGVEAGWTPVAGADGYVVSRTPVPLGSAGVEAPGLRDDAVEEGAVYAYSIRAWNAFGESAASAPVEAGPLSPAAVPSSPSGLRAEGRDGEVRLRWNGVWEAEDYAVGRAETREGPFAEIGTASGTEFRDATAANGTAAYYVVIARNALGGSLPAGPVRAEPRAATAPPGGARGLRSLPGNGRAWLSWEEAAGAQSYRVERALQGDGPWEPAGEVEEPVFTESGLLNGTDYYYRVVALNGAGEAPAQSVERVRPVEAFPMPPAGLWAYGGDRQIGLRWQPSAGAIRYGIYRSTVSGGPYARVGETDQVEFGQTGLRNGRTYYYVVTPIGPEGEGVETGEVAAVPHEAPVCGATGAEALLALLGLLRRRRARAGRGAA